MKSRKQDVDEIRQRETKLSSEKMDEDQKLKVIQQLVKEKKTATEFTKQKVCILGNYVPKQLSCIVIISFSFFINPFRCEN